MGKFEQLISFIEKKIEKHKKILNDITPDLSPTENYEIERYTEILELLKKERTDL